MRPPRALLALAALSAAAAVGFVAVPPAAADCSGPTFSSITEVDGGAALAITGYGWGEECYDTGPPPPGVGHLGEPMRDIEIVIAQGAREFVVARGAADADYELAVTVPVPAELVAGEAGLWGRRIGATAEAPAILSLRPFVLSAAPASTATTLPAIATFGPADAAAAAPEPAAGTEEAGPVITSSTAMPTDVSRPSNAVLAGAVVLVAAVTAGCGFLLVRRRRRSAT